MEAVLQGSDTREVVYSRKDIFLMVKDVWNYDINVQLRAIESKLSEKHNVPFEIHLNTKNSLKTLLTKMKQKWKACTRGIDKFYAKEETWLSTKVTIANALSPEQPLTSIENVESGVTHFSKSKKMGRPPLTYERSSDRSKRRKSEQLMAAHTTSELAHATAMSLRRSGFNAAASVLKDVVQRSPTKANMYRSAIKQAKLPHPIEMPPEVALSLIVESKLTVADYLNQRNVALEYNAPIYPSYHKVLEAKKKCYPRNIIITETSAEANLQELLNHTVERIILLQTEVIRTLSAGTVKNLKLIVKWGCDGSSGQSEYKQGFSDPKSSDTSIFLTSLVPLRLVASDHVSQNEIIVWKNPRPSSPRYCRPIRIQFLNEDVQSTLNEKRYIEEQVECLVPYKTFVDGKEMTVTFSMFFTMIDGKVCNSVTETKSTMRCYLCGATSKDFNNLEFVKGKKLNDSYLRYGMSSLHAWIRFFECLLHLGYKLGTKKWQSRGKKDKEITAERKRAIQDGFKTKLFLKVDIPKQGFGSSNDGNTARRFFQASDISAQILGVDVELLKRFHIILQVISCGFSVNIKAFDDYCMDTARLFVELYPWYYMPTSIHKVLIHGPQIIDAAELPIGELSEDAQEARNKDFKKYRESFSRKVSREKTMEDVFHWLLASSDPLITGMRKVTPKKTKTLSIDAIKLLLSSDGSPYVGGDCNFSCADEDSSASE